MKRINDLISREGDLTTIYRLLCIKSIVEGGIEPSVHNHLIKEISESYGIGPLITLNN